MSIRSPIVKHRQLRPMFMRIIIVDTGYETDAAPRKPSGFWTIEYYQPYFDVDTKTVSQIILIFHALFVSRYVLF